MRTLSLGPLIAALSSSILSLTAGHHLSYVIAAVSGAGVTAIVPLAIFAVSTVIALISVAYLVKLAVSRAGNKKEIGLSGEKLSQSGHTVSQEPQRFAYNNFTNLENKSSMPTLTPPPVKPGAQPNSSPSVPPPPPLPGFHNSSTRSGSANAELRSTKPDGASDSIDHSALFTQIQKGNFLLKKVINPDEPKVAKKPSSGDREDLLAQIGQGLELKPTKPKKDEQQRQPNAVNQDIASILARRVAIEHSDSEDEHENGGCRSEEWDDEEKDYQQTLNPLSGNKKRSESPDSGNVSDGDAKSKPTSPLLPPKPANLQTKSKVPPVKKEDDINLVDSEVQDPFALSCKERAKLFENI